VGGEARLTRETRRYDSPVRRARVEATREGIVAAGAELLHGFPVWNWGALTIKAVAERVGLTERTVYRYFPNERALRDAVMARMEQESGVELEGLSVERVQDVAARIFDYVSRFPLAPRTPQDPTVAAANLRQREALLGAVTDATHGWPAGDRAIVAGLLDVLWSPVSFERLVLDWGIDEQDAISGITWAIGLIQQALAQPASDGGRPMLRTSRKLSRPSGPSSRPRPDSLKPPNGTNGNGG
jgi:AcrR family transcriptional regulator